MANKNLSRKPMNIDKNNWYYEEPGYINLIHIPEGPELTISKKAVHVKISWRKLRASLNRKDKK